jgi:hypothetical protein
MLRLLSPLRTDVLAVGLDQSPGPGRGHSPIGLVSSGLMIG